MSDIENVEYFNSLRDEFGTADYIHRYLISQRDHIRYVRRAGTFLGVPKAQLEIHDASKFSAEELPAAAGRFYDGNPSPDAYAVAWLHHIHHNPHHWQHFLFPDGHTPEGSSVEAGALEMPEHYALEMIADWMGSSMAYTGAWDMTDWLTANMGRIRLHSKTAAYARGVLADLGYGPLVYRHRWAHEGNDVTGQGDSTPERAAAVVSRSAGD